MRLILPALAFLIAVIVGLLLQGADAKPAQSMLKVSPLAMGMSKTI